MPPRGDRGRDAVPLADVLIAIGFGAISVSITVGLADDPAARAVGVGLAILHVAPLAVAFELAVLLEPGDGMDGLARRRPGPRGHVLDLLRQRADELDRRIAELRSLRGEGRRLVDRAEGLAQADCDPGRVCHLIGSS